MSLSLQPLINLLEKCPGPARQQLLDLLEATGCYDLVAPPLDDLQAVTSGYSVRRLLSSYSGPLFRLRRDSDDAEMDFFPNAIGDTNLTQISTWLGGADGFLVTFYDQSGNLRHLEQVTNVEQPIYDPTGPNGHPTFTFDGVDDYVRDIFGAVIPSPQHVFALSRLETWTDQDYLWDGGVIIEMGFLMPDFIPQVRATTGPSGEPRDMSVGDFHIINSYYINIAGDHYLRLDGDEVFADPAAQVGRDDISGLVLGSRGDLTLFGNISFSEFLLFDAEQNNPLIEANMSAYYAVPVI